MSTTPPTTLEEARDRIDEIDRRFVELLAERYALVDDLCAMKAANDDAVKDEEREQELRDHVAAIAEEHGLSPELTRRLYDEILAHSVQRQRRQREEEEAEAARSESPPPDDSCSMNGSVSRTGVEPPARSDDARAA